MSAMIEPFFYCLLASVIWAPIVLIGALRFQKMGTELIGSKLWPAALILAALPVLVAPIVGAMGLSLRSAPPVIEAPIASPATMDFDIAAAAETARPEMTITLATVLKTGRRALFLWVYLVSAAGRRTAYLVRLQSAIRL